MSEAIVLSKLKYFSYILHKQASFIVDLFFKRTIKSGCLAFCLIASRADAIDQAVQTINFNAQDPRPWFTGPILCPSAYVVPVGHINIQPYYYYTYSKGYYDNSWNARSFDTLYTQLIQIPFKFGVVDKMDFGLVPAVIGQQRKGQSSWGLSDCVVSAGFQVLNAGIDDPWPAVKIGIRASLPLGKYKNLDPKKLRTDIHGTGNYFPSVGLVVGKLWHLKGIHYFELRLASYYAFSTHVTVNGKSLYNSLTVKKGTVHPGDVITGTVAVQYNFNKRWAFACDVFYRHRLRASYIGPFNPKDVDVIENKRVSDNFSLAPALEYNFSENLGLIGGCWFSIAGRNTLNFNSGVISLNIYI